MLITRGGLPVKTEDSYCLSQVPGKPLVNLLFAGMVIRENYRLLGRSLEGNAPLSFLVNHKKRTVTVLERLCLLGGNDTAKLVQAFTRATFAVVAQQSPYALFAVVFLQSLEEQTSFPIDQLVTALEEGYRNTVRAVAQIVQDQFAKKTAEEIAEEHIVASTNVFNYMHHPNESYLAKALVAGDRTCAKINSLTDDDKVKFQTIFASAQAMRYDVHLAYSKMLAAPPESTDEHKEQTVESTGERAICKSIADQTIDWLTKAQKWEVESHEHLLAVTHTSKPLAHRAGTKPTRVNIHSKIHHRREGVVYEEPPFVIANEDIPMRSQAERFHKKRHEIAVQRSQAMLEENRHLLVIWRGIADKT